MALASSWYSFVDPSVQARVLWYTGCAALGRAWIATDVFRLAGPERSRLRPIAWVFGTFGVILLWRWLWSAMGPPMAGFLAAGFIHGLTLLTYVGFVLFKDLALLDATVSRLIAETRHLADTDPLAGLANRRVAMGCGQAWLDRARQAGSSLGVILLDVDHFKSINDQYGHAAGDDVLVAVARVLECLVPPGGLAARVGGEEFLLLLPDTALEEAARLAESARLALHHLEPSDSRRLDLSASFGVTMATGHVAIDTAIAQADRALLTAKASGRDQVFVVPADGGAGSGNNLLSFSGSLG